MDEQKMKAMAREDLLARISDGMEVHDSTGDHIGKVDAVYLGAKADGDAAQGGPITPGDAPADAVDADVTVFAGFFFTKSDIPEEVRERLRYDGFIRIAPHGLFRTHRYATREQVGAVDGDHVTLLAAESKLIKG